MATGDATTTPIVGSERPQIAAVPHAELERRAALASGMRAELSSLVSIMHAIGDLLDFEDSREARNAQVLARVGTVMVRTFFEDAESAADELDTAARRAPSRSSRPHVPTPQDMDVNHKAMWRRRERLQMVRPIFKALLDDAWVDSPGHAMLRGLAGAGLHLADDWGGGLVRAVNATGQQSSTGRTTT